MRRWIAGPGPNLVSADFDVRAARVEEAGADADAEAEVEALRFTLDDAARVLGASIASCFTARFALFLAGISLPL